MTRRPATPWSAVLFDLDGTLADTVELILRCYRHTMVVHRGAALPDELWLNTIGTRLHDQLRAFARDDAELGRMVDTYSAHQDTLHDELVRPYPGVLALISGLRARSVPIGVVTSKRRRMASRTLAQCGLDGAYEVLVGGDDVRRGKPDPEPVSRALSALAVGGSESRVLFVGDSPYDMRAGRSAGTRTGGALWGPFPGEALARETPDFLVSRPEDVLDLRPPEA